ncbi:MAG TPA: helix-turn-helix domain-containing protein [Steroidobacteraceae bacterium]|jgi:DNA-binding HxlR family transcriptional regulator
MPKHPAADVYSSACPSRRVLAMLAEKWTLLIVAQLADGPMRTAEIRRKVEGVSEKMLIQTLRKLESYGLVSRKSYPEIPPRVEYRLTPLGRSLARLAGLFGRWVEKNVAALLRAEITCARPAVTETRPDPARVRRIASA